MIKLLFFCALNWASEDPHTLAAQCLDHEVDLFESVKGRLPNPYEADLIVDMCVKLAFEKEPKIESTRKSSN